MAVSWAAGTSVDVDLGDSCLAQDNKDPDPSSLIAGVRLGLRSDVTKTLQQRRRRWMTVKERRRKDLPASLKEW